MLNIKKIKYAITIVAISVLFFKFPQIISASYTCGETFTDPYPYTNCDCENFDTIKGNVNTYFDSYCCGWYEDGICHATNPNPSPTPTESIIDSETGEVTSETLDSFNPLIIGAGDTTLSDPGSIITKALTYIFPIAGLILFVMILWGGFEMLISSTNQQNIDAGKQRVTAAIVGFIILFASYWIAQILEKVFNIGILG